jgi:hypothetical protein
MWGGSSSCRHTEFRKRRRATFPHWLGWSSSHSMRIMEWGCCVRVQGRKHLAFKKSLVSIGPGEGIEGLLPSQRSQRTLQGKWKTAFCSLGAQFCLGKYGLLSRSVRIPAYSRAYMSTEGEGQRGDSEHCIAPSGSKGAKLMKLRQTGLSISGAMWSILPELLMRKTGSALYTWKAHT